MSAISNEMDEKFQELASTKTVRGVLILNSDGAPIKTSLEPKATDSYASMLHEIVGLARKLFLENDPNNDLTFVRFRLKKHEIMVAPDKQYYLVVIHHPQE